MYVKDTKLSFSYRLTEDSHIPEVTINDVSAVEFQSCGFHFLLRLLKMFLIPLYGELLTLETTQTHLGKSIRTIVLENVGQCD